MAGPRWLWRQLRRARLRRVFALDAPGSHRGWRASPLRALLAGAALSIGLAACDTPIEVLTPAVGIAAIGGGGEEAVAQAPTRTLDLQMRVDGPTGDGDSVAGVITLTGAGATSAIYRQASSRTTVAGDSLLEFVAQPAPGFAFLQWSGSCSGTEAVCRLDLRQVAEGTVRVEAVFTPLRTLFLNIQPAIGEPLGAVEIAGRVTATVSANQRLDYLPGDRVALTPLPAARVTVQWLGDCANPQNQRLAANSQGRDVPVCEMVMDRDRVAEIHFIAQRELRIETVGMGRIDYRALNEGVALQSTSVGANAAQTETVNNGTNMEFDAAPSPGHLFAGYSADSVCLDRANPQCAFRVAADGQVVTAHFGAPAPLAVNIGSDSSGTGSVTPAGLWRQSHATRQSSFNEPVPVGVAVTLTAEPGADSIFAGWRQDCAAFGYEPRCEFVVDSSAGRVVGARFAELFDLLVRARGFSGGVGAVDVAGFRLAGDTFTVPTGQSALYAVADDDLLRDIALTATASTATPSVFMAWVEDPSGGCPENMAVAACVASMTEDRDVSAWFGLRGGLQLTVERATAGPSGPIVAEWLAQPPGSLFSGAPGQRYGVIFTTGAISGGADAVPLAASSADGRDSARYAVPLPLHTTVTLTATAPPNTYIKSWGGAALDSAACRHPEVSFCTFFHRQFDEPVSVRWDVYNVLTASNLGQGSGALQVQVQVSGARPRRQTISFAGGVATGTAAGAVDSLPDGATVTLQAVEEPGSQFLGWGGACAAVATQSCELTITSSTTVSVNFAPLTFGELAVNADQGAELRAVVALAQTGTTTVPIAASATASFVIGDVDRVTLSVSRILPGYEFREWTGCSSTPTNSATGLADCVVTGAIAITAPASVVTVRSVVDPIYYYLGISVDPPVSGRIEAQIMDRSSRTAISPATPSVSVESIVTLRFVNANPLEYVLDAWGGACAGVDPQQACQLSAFSIDTRVTAEAVGLYQLSLSVAERTGGDVTVNVLLADGVTPASATTPILSAATPSLRLREDAAYLLRPVYASADFELEWLNVPAELTTMPPTCPLTGTLDCELPARPGGVDLNFGVRANPLSRLSLALFSNTFASSGTGYVPQSVLRINRASESTVTLSAADSSTVIVIAPTASSSDVSLSLALGSGEVFAGWPSTSTARPQPLRDCVPADDHCRILSVLSDEAATLELRFERLLGLDVVARAGGGVSVSAWDALSSPPPVRQPPDTRAGAAFEATATITASASFSVEFLVGERLTLDASALPDFRFAGWVGADAGLCDSTSSTRCVLSASPTTIFVDDSPFAIEASFNLVPKALTVAASRSTPSMFAADGSVDAEVLGRDGGSVRTSIAAGTSATVQYVLTDTLNLIARTGLQDRFVQWGDVTGCVGGPGLQDATCVLPGSTTRTSITANFDVFYGLMAVFSSASVSVSPGIAGLQFAVLNPSIGDEPIITVSPDLASTGSTLTLTSGVPVFFQSGATLTVTATPESGETFGSWNSTRCAAATSSCTLTMDADVALFPSLAGQVSHLRVVGPGSARMVRGDDDITVPSGLGGFLQDTSMVAAMAEASPAEFFDSWSGSHCQGSTATSCVIASTVSIDNIALVATFRASRIAFQQIRFGLQYGPAGGDWFAADFAARPVPQSTVPRSAMVATHVLDDPFALRWDGTNAAIVNLYRCATAMPASCTTEVAERQLRVEDSLDAAAIALIPSDLYGAQPNEHGGSRFGHAVAISGDGLVMAVGAPQDGNATASGVFTDPATVTPPAAGESERPGAVYVYRRPSLGTTWRFDAYIKTPARPLVAGALTAAAANAAIDGDLFGFDVALSHDGSVLAVGAPGSDSGAGGAVYNSTAINSYDPADPAADLTDSLLAAARAQTVTDAGAVFVYRYRGATPRPWALEAFAGGRGIFPDVQGNVSSSDARFGQSVSLSADGAVLAAGAPGKSYTVTVSSLEDLANGLGIFRLGGAAVLRYLASPGTWVLDAASCGVDVRSSGGTAITGGTLYAPFNQCLAEQRDREAGDMGYLTSAVDFAVETVGPGGVVANPPTGNVLRQRLSATIGVPTARPPNPAALYGAQVALSADGGTLAVLDPIPMVLAQGYQPGGGNASTATVYVYRAEPSSGTTFRWRAPDFATSSARVLRVDIERPGVPDRLSTATTTSFLTRGLRIALSADGLSLAVGTPLDSGPATANDIARFSGVLPSGMVGDNVGAARVHTRPNSSSNAFSLTAYFKPSIAVSGDRFGASVSFARNGINLWVGAPGRASRDIESTLARRFGAALLGDRWGAVTKYSGRRHGSGIWNLDISEAQLPSSYGNIPADIDTRGQADFGFSVAVSANGASVVVGAPESRYSGFAGRPSVGSFTELKFDGADDLRVMPSDLGSGAVYLY